MREGDELGDRMKNYEAAYKYSLPERLPIILRVDGKAFHTLTKSLQKPFDEKFIKLMNDTAKHLCEGIQGAKFAYMQSDEISILIYAWHNKETTPWFGNELIKMVSIAASLATSYFTLHSNEAFGMQRQAMFDARAFILPNEEVVNYFEWRQQDWKRNSIQLLARKHFSHKALMHVNGLQAIDMLRKEKGVAWEELPMHLQRGRGLKKVKVKVTALNHILGVLSGNEVIRNKWLVDNDLPIFHTDRGYLENLMLNPIV